MTDFGGNPGVIKDGVNGFLTATHKPDELADALEKLFCDSELYNSMSKNCRKMYEENFTAEVNSRRIENVYRRVCESRNGGKEVE